MAECGVEDVHRRVARIAEYRREPDGRCDLQRGPDADDGVVAIEIDDHDRDIGWRAIRELLDQCPLVVYVEALMDHHGLPPAPPFATVLR